MGYSIFLTSLVKVTRGHKNKGALEDWDAQVGEDVSYEDESLSSPAEGFVFEGIYMNEKACCGEHIYQGLTKCFPVSAPNGGAAECEDRFMLAHPS